MSYGEKNIASLAFYFAFPKLLPFVSTDYIAHSKIISMYTCYWKLALEGNCGAC